MDVIDFEHLSVLPHIQYNGMDEPITFFDLIIDVQGYAERLRGVPRVDLCVGKFRDGPGEN